MGRMENPNLEDTSPIHIQPEPQTPVDPGETRPIVLDLGSPEANDIEQTVRTPLRPEQAGAENTAETMPVPVKPEIPQPPPPAGPPGPEVPVRRSFSLRSWSLLGLLGLLLVGLLSAFGGYTSGIGQRTSAQATQLAGVVDEQFQLGIQDMEAHRFDLARQRFEYVI